MVFNYNRTVNVYKTLYYQFTCRPRDGSVSAFNMCIMCGYFFKVNNFPLHIVVSVSIEWAFHTNNMHFIQRSTCVCWHSTGIISGSLIVYCVHWYFILWRKNNRWNFFVKWKVTACVPPVDRQTKSANYQDFCHYSIHINASGSNFG